MLITRNNYEEYFILYLDNELDQEGRKAVEAFVLAHPDLGEELELLLQTRFVPDQQLSYEDKESLFRSEEAELITPDNYREWLLMHTDRELNAEQEQVLAHWLARNPAYQAELDQLLRTRFEADPSIVFPDKSLLYRKEAPRRAILVSWRRIAVAASFLVAIATTALFLVRSGNTGNSNEPGSSLATNDKPDTEKQPAEKINNPVATNESSSDQNDTKHLTADPATVNPAVKVNDNNIARSAQQRSPATTQQKDDNNNTIASVNTGTNGNRLPDGSHSNPNLASDGRVDNSNYTAENTELISFNAPAATPLTNSKQINVGTTVTPSDLQPLKPVYAAVNMNETADTDESGRKGLRGFFRKVTRTFEKATNMKATDENDRLLIGALAIQL